MSINTTHAYYRDKGHLKKCMIISNEKTETYLAVFCTGSNGKSGHKRQISEWYSFADNKSVVNRKNASSTSLLLQSFG